MRLHGISKEGLRRIAQAGDATPRMSKQVTKYVRDAGFPGYELIKGKGYFYWWADGSVYEDDLMFGDPAGWYSSNVDVYSIRNLTFDQWLDTFLGLGMDAVVHTEMAVLLGGDIGSYRYYFQPMGWVLDGDGYLKEQLEPGTPHPDLEGKPGANLKVTRTERMKADDTNPEDIGGVNAATALDQLEEYEPHERWDSIMSYYENVSDTVLEYGGDSEMVGRALDAFNEVAGEELEKYEAIKSEYDLGEEGEVKLQGLSKEAVERIARKTGMAFLADPPTPESEKYKGIIEYPGFHTTGNFNIAAMYAVGRVSQSFLDEDEEGIHFVKDYPVVVSLDMAGHSPQTDYDAEEMVWNVLKTQLDGLTGGWGDPANITVDSTDEEINAAAEEAAEMSENTSEATDPLDMIAEESFWNFENPMRGLVDDPDFPDAFRQYLQTGEFSPELLMRATDQYRYTEDVGEERLLAVWFITPIASEMGDYDTDEDVKTRWPGFDVPWIDDVYSRSHEPASELVWEDEEPRYEEDLPGQLPLFTQEQLPREPVIQYHGTTLSRLLQASPELAGQLPAPPSPPYQGELAMAARRTANESLEGEIDLPGGYASISWQDGVLYLFNFEADEPGHGSGSQMWEALKEMIPSGTTVELDSFLSAVDFWEKMGFEQIGPIDDGYQPMRMVAMAARRVAQYEPYQPPGVDMEGLPQIWLEEIVGGIYRVRVDTESDRFGHINREGRKWEATIRHSDGELIHYAGIWDSLRAAIHEVAFYLDRDAFLEMPDEWYYP